MLMKGSGKAARVHYLPGTFRLLSDGDHVDIVAHWPGDDVDRRVRSFRVVEYDTPLGCAAAYFPEANVLVPLDSTAETSNTPTSKSTVIRLERSA